MNRHFDRHGQATTELAIFGTVLLLAFAAMLRWGEVMNKQQEMSMLSFRRAMHKAYADYRGGSGFGAASYRMLGRIRIVEPFNKYYTGSQRQQIGAGNSVFWDPDLLYAEGGDKPKTYYNVDGQEHDLGTDADIWDVATNTVTYIDNLKMRRQSDSHGHEDFVRAKVKEEYETLLKLEDESGVNQGEIPIYTEKDYSKKERWTTSW